MSELLLHIQISFGSNLYFVEVHKRKFLFHIFLLSSFVYLQIYFVHLYVIIMFAVCSTVTLSYAQGEKARQPDDIKTFVVKLQLLLLQGFNFNIKRRV